MNFVACHDGFTLADVTAFNEKHNEANGEDNRDGHQENYSDNCGEEGESEDSEIRLRRARRRRNLLASVFLAQGTPMLRAGDEVADSQRGNNNAYCQDNAVSWIDWAASDTALLGFTRRLSALRRAHSCLRQSRFLHGRERAEDGTPDVEWFGLEGGPHRLGRPGPCGLLPAAQGIRRGADPCRRRRSDGACLQPIAQGGFRPAARAWRRPGLAARSGHCPTGGSPDHLPRSPRRHPAPVDCRL